MNRAESDPTHKMLARTPNKTGGPARGDKRDSGRRAGPSPHIGNGDPYGQPGCHRNAQAGIIPSAGRIARRTGSMATRSRKRRANEAAHGCILLATPDDDHTKRTSPAWRLEAWTPPRSSATAYAGCQPGGDCPAVPGRVGRDGLRGKGTGRGREWRDNWRLHIQGAPL